MSEPWARAMSTHPLSAAQSASERPAAAAFPEVRTEPLGGSALARAALAREVPHGWYPPGPLDAPEWHLHADAVRRQFTAGAWYELLRPAFEAHGAAAARLERSAGGTGVVVTTGQQPGLFGGPLYTLTKAVSARALADALEASTGLPVAPVFWAATDDADYEEARHTAVALDGAVRTLRLDGTPAEGTPMSAMRLGAETPALLERLVAASGSAAYTEALDAARESHRPGVTVGDAYVRLLRVLLEPLGIAVLDASHPAVREAGFNVLRRALLQAPAIEQALGERTTAMTAAGHAPQVSDVAGRSLVFRYGADGRKARLTIGEARAAVTTSPRGSLGPNVLLRPVVERSILPTVAYVAGPGEYAYFAQVSAVATALGVPQPLAVPRWSATIIEPHVRRALDRIGMQVDDLRDPHRADAQLARAAMPPAIDAALGQLRMSVERATEALRAAGNGTGALVPDPVVDGAARALSHRLDRLERRYVAALKRRDDETSRALAVARCALFPGGVRQERVLNPLPLIARHGPALLESMLEAARAHAQALVNGPEPRRA